MTEETSETDSEQQEHEEQEPEQQDAKYDIHDVFAMSLADTAMEMLLTHHDLKEERMNKKLLLQKAYGVIGERYKKIENKKKLAEITDKDGNIELEGNEELKFLVGKTVDEYVKPRKKKGFIYHKDEETLTNQVEIIT
jgi:hypothetical protein